MARRTRRLALPLLFAFLLLDCAAPVLQDLAAGWPAAVPTAYRPVRAVADAHGAAAPWRDVRGLAFLERLDLGFDAHHVQGLVVTAEAFFVSAVDLWQRRGWLFKVDRTTRRLLARAELTDAAMIHPGGLGFDGRLLWVPTAEYDRGGPTRVQALDPATLAPVRGFVVDDHVSLLVSDGKGRLYGTSWDSRVFYAWTPDGHLVARVPSPTGVAYQDCAFAAPHLICGGERGSDAVIDVLDPVRWQLVHRIDAGETPFGRRLTREGLAYAAGRLYLLPEDGPGAAVLTFALRR